MLTHGINWKTTTPKKKDKKEIQMAQTFWGSLVAKYIPLHCAIYACFCQKCKNHAYIHRIMFQLAMSRAGKRMHFPKTSKSGRRRIIDGTAIFLFVPSTLKGEYIYTQLYNILQGLIKKGVIILICHENLSSLQYYVTGIHINIFYILYTSLNCHLILKGFPY